MIGPCWFSDNPVTIPLKVIGTPTASFDSGVYWPEDSPPDYCTLAPKPFRITIIDSLTWPVGPSHQLASPQIIIT